MENEATFTVSVVGETTGDTYSGSFTVKTRLSHRDALTKDRIRRELLGPGTPTPRAESLAEIFSQLAVRILKAPKTWWMDNGNGQDLADDNVVAEVYNKALKAEADAIEAVKAKAAEAAGELAKDK